MNPKRLKLLSGNSNKDKLIVDIQKYYIEYYLSVIKRSIENYICPKKFNKDFKNSHNEKEHEVKIVKNKLKKFNFFSTQTYMSFNLLINLLILFILSPIILSESGGKIYITIEMDGVGAFKKLINLEHIQKPINIFYLNYNVIDDSSIVKESGNYLTFKCPSSSTSCTVKVDWGRKKNTENEPEIQMTNVVVETTPAPPSTVNADDMFKECNTILSIDFTYYYTEKISSASQMFLSCTSLKSIESLNFGKSNDLSKAFQSCTALTTVNIDFGDRSSAKKMDYMFSGCTALTTISIDDEIKISNMDHMFYNCKGLKKIDSITNFIYFCILFIL